MCPASHWFFRDVLHVSIRLSGFTLMNSSFAILDVMRVIQFSRPWEAPLGAAPIVYLCFWSSPSPSVSKLISTVFVRSSLAFASAAASSARAFAAASNCADFCFASAISFAASFSAFDEPPLKL
jgi:hypothetical protein